MNLFKSSPFKISSLILLFILSLSPSVFAGAPDTLWTRTYGGANDDFGYSVQQTSDGGFIIAGSSNSFSEFDNHNVYLIRTNESGDTLWTRTYGGNSSELGQSVLETSDGGFIITGKTSSIGAGKEDVYLIRTDSNGDTLWSKTFGGNENDVGNSVLQTSDSGFVIAGLTTLEDLHPYIYLIRTNLHGDTLWTKTYGRGIGYSVIQTINDEFIVAGYKIPLITNGIMSHLIKTNSVGDTLWTKTYGGDSTDLAYSVQQTDNGGFIVAGYTNSFGAGNLDAYLINTNSNGDTLWTRTYGGIDTDWGYSVQQTSDGGFIMAGETYSYGIGGSDVYLVRYNSNGDTLWTKTIGGAVTELGRSVQQTKDGGYIITGSSNSFSTDDHDVYLIRLGKDSTGIQGDTPKNIINQNNIVVSGDNKNNLISISYTIHHPSSVKLSMYNISGQLVQTLLEEHKNRGEYSVQFKTDKISSGVYYVMLEAGESRYTRKSTVVE